MSKRAELIAKIQQYGLPEACWRSNRPLPIVSLEDFFTGNTDVGAIGCNLSPPPNPQTFFRAFQAIRSRPDVQDVLVEIHDVEEQDETMWPFAETIYILSSATQGQVVEWIEPLQPSSVTEDTAFIEHPQAPALQPNMRVFAAWWD